MKNKSCPSLFRIQTLITWASPVELAPVGFTILSCNPHILGVQTSPGIKCLTPSLI